MAVFKGTVTVRDEKERTAEVIFYFNEELNGFPEFGFDGIWAYFQELVKRLDAFITGVIVNASLSINVNLPTGIKTEPDADSDVEEKAEIKFTGRTFVIGEDVFPARNYSQTIPTFDHSRFPDGETQFRANDDADVEYYTFLITNSTDAADWADEYGGLSDYRGTQVANIENPLIMKRFGKSKGN